MPENITQPHRSSLLTSAYCSEWYCMEVVSYGLFSDGGRRRE